MTETLITFETAKLAKEKGLCNFFNKGTEYVNAFYSENGVDYEETEFQQGDCLIEDRYFRPTQSLLQKWLREVHGILTLVDFDKNSNGVGYTVNWQFIQDLSKGGYSEITFNSYEEALEFGLQHALKLIKNDETN